MKQILIAIIGIFILPMSLLAAGEQVVDIDIEGMSCKFCAYSVQKNLKKIPDVESASVSVDDKKAHIVMVDGKQADIELLKKKINDAGFVPVKVTISTLE